MFETSAPLLVRFLICFTLGSIPFAVLAMLGSGIDIRKIGSGNPGFNNVLRLNRRRALLALAGDMGKGYLGVWLVLRVWPLHHASAPWMAGGVALGWLYAFGAVLGHCFSPFLRFNGGKGIAASGGAMLALYPVWAVLALVYFAVARIVGGKLKWREAGTVASLTTWILFVLLMLVFVGRADAGYSAAMLLLLVRRHKKNLQNLLFGSSVVASGKMGANLQQGADERLGRPLTTD